MNEEHAPVPDDASDEFVDRRIGTIIEGKYEIVRRLGEGGMGVVYEALHTRIKRRVAVKFLHAMYAAEPDIRARFHREAETAAATGHPNIIQVTDLGDLEDGSVFLVMEYLDGRELADDIHALGALPVAKTVHIAMQICDALSAAHDQGIVHRDLKPENVFLIRHRDDPDFVKVLDFGIAKIVTGKVDGPKTQTGAAIGTPYYMAPEQAQGRKGLDKRADVYSLGVILYQMLTGRRPFDEESYVQLLMKICHDPPPSLRAQRGDVPEEMIRVIEQMLAKDRDERPPDCAAVKAALRPFAEFDAAPQLFELPEESTDETGPIPLVEPGDATPTAAQPARTDRPSVEPAPSTPGIPATKSSRGLWLGGAALAVAGAIAIALVIGLSGPDAEPVAEDVPVDTPPPAGEEVPGAPTGVENERVHVRIETVPAEAALRLDGQNIANPFDGELPRVDGQRRIEASLDGFVTVVRELSLSHPQTVRLELRAAQEEPAEQPETTDADRRRAERARERDERRARARAEAEAAASRMTAAEPPPVMETVMTEAPPPVETATTAPPPTMQEEVPDRALKTVRF